MQSERSAQMREARKANDRIGNCRRVFFLDEMRAAAVEPAALSDGAFLPRSERQDTRQCVLHERSI
jgi:hypothetical protein